MRALFFFTALVSLSLIALRGRSAFATHIQPPWNLVQHLSLS